jgi:uncharacterized protein (TIGR02646 family)
VEPISKQREPCKLALYRRTPGASYGAMPQGVKPAIQESLLQEQGYVCAYCMRRIGAGSMKIEHWDPQANHDGNDLDYANMLGCCSGKIGEMTCCDTCRGNLNSACQALKYNPADSGHHRCLRIHYKSDGRIFSDDSEFSDQLSSVLNLNNARLIENRKAVMKGVSKSFENMRTINERQLESLLDKWGALDSNGMYREYYGVAKFFIQKRMDRI